MGSINKYSYQVLQKNLFGMVKREPFKWLSDLQIGDEKVTLNHLVPRFTFNFNYMQVNICQSHG